MNSTHTWFDQSRFGLFIHWGAYSVAARGEWLANRERVPKEEYIRRYVDHFHAEAYAPEDWAALAVEAGMGYAVLTTRHHDGFALWPTETSDFHAGCLGPKRDLVGPYVEAFRKAGLKVGFYFSPADWFHPDYPGSTFRDWPGENDWTNEEARLRFIDYYRQQIRELLTNYGRIDYLWYDGCIPSNLQSCEANEEALRLQPHLLINERNGPPFHVHVSEQAIKPGPIGEPWEACMTLNDNWGYHAGDANWKSPGRVIQMLTETAAGAGNLLLNVGPRADGTIPTESVKILREVGGWLRRNGESIHGSARSPFPWITSGRVTTVAGRVYLHLWLGTGKEFCYAELKNRVLTARLLDSGQDVRFEQNGDRLILHDLPDLLPDRITTTIVLEIEGDALPVSAQTTFWIPG